MENVAQRYNWSKFYWNDWGNDAALQACDMASQGLWINLLRLMFHSEKPGFLQINGKPMTALQIAKRTGFDRRSIEKKLAVLIENKVCSVDDRGVLYSRRMVREIEARVKQNRKEDASQSQDRSNRVANTQPTRSKSAASLQKEIPEIRQKTQNPLYTEADTEPDIEEEREERIPPNPPLANQGNVVALDDRSRLFKIGVRLLVEMTGKPDAACRGLIGKWLKQCGNEAGWLLQTLEKANARKPYNPEAYISKIVQQSTIPQSRQKFEKRDPRQEMREDWHLTNSLQEFREKYDRNDDLNDPLWYIPEHLRQKQIAGGSK